MPKIRNLDELRIAEPCSEPWEQMAGNDEVRFCSHCAKHVNNLSAMTQRDAMKLVRRSGGNICVRYAIDTVTEEPVFAGRFHQISRRAPVLAAGVIGATLSIASAGYSQGAARASGRTQPEAQAPGDPRPAEAKGEISGTLIAESGNPVPGRSVTVRNKATGATRQTRSASDGTYMIQGLPPGSYSLTVEPGGGLEGYTLDDIEVTAGIRSDEILTLPVAERIFLSGGISMTPRRYTHPLTKAVDRAELDDVRSILASGADPNAREEDGRTALFFAVRDGEIEILQALLLFGADINARDEDGETPLMQIDEDTTEDVIRTLLDAGAKVNRTAKDGTTPLMRAAEDAKPEIVRILIDAGAEINARDEEGWTPLMKAAYDDDIEKVRMLLTAGADVNAKNNDGETAWDQTGVDEIEDLLVSFGAVVPEDKPDDGTSDGSETEAEAEDGDS